MRSRKGGQPCALRCRKPHLWQVTSEYVAAHQITSWLWLWENTVSTLCGAAKSFSCATISPPDPTRYTSSVISPASSRNCYLRTVLVPRRSVEQSTPLTRVNGKTSEKRPSRQAREQKTVPPKTHARARPRLLNKKISTPKNVHAPGTCLKQLQRCIRPLPPHAHQKQPTSFVSSILRATWITPRTPGPHFSRRPSSGKASKAGIS